MDNNESGINDQLNLHTDEPSEVGTYTLGCEDDVQNEEYNNTECNSAEGCNEECNNTECSSAEGCNEEHNIAECSSAEGCNEAGHAESITDEDNPGTVTSAQTDESATRIEPVSVSIDASDRKKRREKKHHGFFFRAARNVMCAVLIGAVAGASCYGAMYAGYINFPITADTEDGTLTPEMLKAIELAVKKNSSELSASKLNNVSTVDGTSLTTVIDVSDIVDEVINSVVAINGTQTISNSFYGFSFWGEYPQSYEAPCSGSGIIMGANDTELLVVTNAHVVEDVNNLQVAFCDGTYADAVIKGIKPDSDLAVLAINLDDISAETMAAVSIARLGSSSDIKVGEAAIAIGNAAGYGISVTTGIVSAVDRTLTVDDVAYENLIQTDAAINPGNSGGALFNAQGDVIGINSVKMSDTSVEGMGYAISIESVKDIINDLSTQTTRTALDDEERGYLGVNGNTVTSSISSMYGWPEGVLIKTVAEGSAAEVAGIEVNDVITGFDGKDIDSWETLVNTVQYYKVGESVEVTYYHLERGSFVEKTVTVTLTGKPESSK